jgi:hypothetical protein
MKVTMKPIQFIKGIPAATAREVRLWFWLCFTTGILLIVGISSSTLVRTYRYWSLQQQTTSLAAQLTNFNTIIAECHNYRAQQEIWQRHLTLLEQHHHNPKNPAALLQSLRTLTQHLTITTLSITSRHFELQLTAEALVPLTTALKKINGIAGIEGVVLDSLRTHDNKLQATIRGTINHQSSIVQ